MAEDNKVSTTSRVKPVTTEPNKIDLPKIRQFEQLLEADKSRLYAYIYAIVGEPGAVEDIFQETCLTLWQEFDKFELGTNFSKWANVIAYYRIENSRRINKRYQLGLSDDFLKEFSHNISVFESNHHSQEQKWQHLEHCRSLLSAPLKEVYQSFYLESLTAKQIATNTGRSVHAIRKVVHKIRTQLLACVNKKQQEVSS
ncbi:sigma-70 family RNA polymerase sigma factor [Algibacillus agarilyticus]|uniref:sigma-70 family RNA polymerase sigma factor n=1 Tax=Algibacillus agarilyticus TaxID=2234133 RepID=UPI001E30A048|nr:sigma-70 family RNA polymerase sigma factor [Algibacillus agarilyticus]